MKIPPRRDAYVHDASATNESTLVSRTTDAKFTGLRTTCLNRTDIVNDTRERVAQWTRLLAENRVVPFLVRANASCYAWAEFDEHCYCLDAKKKRSSRRWIKMIRGYEPRTRRRYKRHNIWNINDTIFETIVNRSHSLACRVKRVSDISR